MASIISAQWASYSPRIRLTVTTASKSNTSVKFDWKFEYYAYSPTNTSRKKNYTVRFQTGNNDWSTVASGSYDIDGKKGWHTVRTGTYTVKRGHSATTLGFKCSMTMDITWGGVKKDAISATTNSSTRIDINAKPSYSITYNLNGGSGSFPAQTKWYGEDINIRSGKPTKSGYTFRYWLRDGSTVSYQPLTTVTYNGSQTLIAQWAANTYTVKYNGNAGSNTVNNLPASQTKTYGKTLTLSSKVPTRSGYVFKGWATSSDGSPKYQPSGGYTSNSSITLYAVWYKPVVTDTYIPPQINGLKIVRCNNKGTPVDTGTYCKINFNWQTTNAVKPITISAAETVTGNTVLSTTISASNTSGSVTNYIFGNGKLNSQTTYTITITVADDKKSTSANRKLAPMKFVIDFQKGGTGVAIGKPAERSGFDVAMTMYLDGYVMNISPTTVEAYQSIGMGITETPIDNTQSNKVIIDSPTEQENQIQTTEITESAGDI